MQQFFKLTSLISALQGFCTRMMSIGVFRRVGLVFWIGFLQCHFSAAQILSDTLIEVQVLGVKKPEVQSDEKLKLFSPGQKTINLEKQQLQIYERQSIVQLLYQQTPVFIKSYGINGLATLNFRGSSAAQSQVLWNGVPIHNAALGMADVSLLPVSAVDQVTILYGGSASLFGSGNVGGVLLLENDAPVYDSARSLRTKLSAGMGSFGQYQAGLKMSWTEKKWYLSGNFFGQQAQNNFPYFHRDGQLRAMDHSRLQGGGAQLNMGYRPNAKNEFRLSLWGQQYFRQIPPAIFESSSVKEQDDRSARVLAQWEHRARATVWYLKSAYMQDLMAYRDSAVRMDARNRSGHYYQELGLRRKLLGRADLNLFVPIQWLWLERKDGSLRSQTRIAFAGALRYPLFADRMTVAASFRAERAGNSEMLLPGFNLAYRLMPWLELKGNIQRTFRAPSLNEWYYQPGGNEQLRPEHGWAEEMGYVVRVKTSSRFRFTHETTLFNRDIKDWTLWFGGAIWTPHNIAEVQSRGVEVSGKALWKTGVFDWHLNGAASWIRAATKASHVPNDGSIGMQIPYTPYWQWQANGGLSIRSLYLNYNHVYTGYRFLTTDESQLLPAFHTGNIQAMCRFVRLDVSFQLMAQINNIFGQRYEVVAGRPMPGRNWILGFGLDF